VLGLLSHTLKQDFNMSACNFGFQRVSGREFCTAALGFFLISILLGFFALPTSTHRVFVYIALVLGLVVAYLNRARVSQDLREVFFENRTLVCVVLGYFLYNFLSFFWGDDRTLEDFGNVLKVPIFVSVFVLSLAIVLKKKSGFSEVLQTAYIVVALCVALYLIFSRVMPDFSWSNMARNYRLQGIGRSQNSNTLSNLYAIGILILLFGRSWLDRISKYKSYALKAGLVLFFAAIIFLAVGRGAAVGLACTLLVTAVVSKSPRNLLFVGGILSFGALFMAWRSDFLMRIFKRGDTYRFEIWEQAMDIIAQAPIIGHGVTYDMLFRISASTDYIQTSTHNIFLGIVVLGGVVGLIIFLAMGLLALFKAYKIGRAYGDWLAFSLFVFGIGYMQFSGHTFYGNLSKEWLVSWVPLAYILSYPRNGAVKDQRSEVST
jgi:O-antigen ligase